MGGRGDTQEPTLSQFGKDLSLENFPSDFPLRQAAEVSYGLRPEGLARGNTGELSHDATTHGSRAGIW
jgi:hypothetical protein